MYQSKLLHTVLLKCAGNILIHTLKSFDQIWRQKPTNKISSTKHFLCIYIYIYKDDLEQ